MRIKSIKFLILAFLVFSLTLTGCESLGSSGIDLNEVLKKDYIPSNSYEIKQSISLGLNYDESLIDEDKLVYYKLLDNAKLDLHIQKNGFDIWVKGVLSVYKGDIPFELSLTSDNLVVWVDNAIKPFVITGEEYEEFRGELIDAYSSYMLVDATEELKTANLEIVDFFVRNLPSPNTISYDLNSHTTINNEQVRMKKIDSTILATELPDLSIKFLNNLKNDEALKDILGTLYFNYGSIYMNENEITLDEANQFAESQYEMVVLIIEELIDEIRYFVDTGFIDINDNTYYKTTLYLDDNLRIGKANNLLSFEAPEFISSELGGLKGFEFKSSYELFNVDQEFIVNSIDISNQEYITTDANKKEYYNTLNKQGTLFDILKNDLKLIPEKTFTLTLNNKEVKITNYLNESTNEIMNVSPYSKNGTTLVPIRFISENMGAIVSWDKYTETVTITKGNTIIILTVGSNIALVNGEEIPLNVAPEIKDGSLMVPLRFISDAFNANIYWDGETKTITIEQYN